MIFENTFFPSLFFSLFIPTISFPSSFPLFLGSLFSVHRQKGSICMCKSPYLQMYQSGILCLRSFQFKFILIQEGLSLTPNGKSCLDRSEKMADSSSSRDDLCFKSSRLKENEEKLVFQYLKGNLRPSRKEEIIVANLSHCVTIWGYINFYVT